MREYEHKIQYYETDKMGITHHSNYIRWMEEARLDFLSQIGWDFAEMEAGGVLSPVVSVECRYKKPTTYPETIQILVMVEEFKGVKLKLAYEMKNAKGETVCEGKSEHCFLNPDGRPMRMDRKFPELFEALNNQIRKQPR